MCCRNLLELHFEKENIYQYSTYSSFLVINVCNQGKTLCSPCRSCIAVFLTLRNERISFRDSSQIKMENTKQNLTLPSD